MAGKYSGVFSGDNPIVKFGKKAQEAVDNGTVEAPKPNEVAGGFEYSADTAKELSKQSNKRAKETAKPFLEAAHQFDSDPRNAPRHDNGSVTGENSVFNDGATTVAEQERPDNSNKSIEEIIAESKKNYGLVDDYYGNSMSEMWKNLSPEDRKILVLDQLGTSLKNISKARLPMYSAYGKSYEGEGVGDEKSMLQKGIQDSFKAGLDRRNNRLNTQMDNILKQANFPANLSMQLKTMWESGDLNNRQKTNFIRLMSDVNFMDALKAGAVSIAANGQILNQAGSVIGSLL